MDDYNKQFVALMQESGWLPEDIVRELGITKGAVSQYRSGKTRPSLTVLRLFGARTNLPLALIEGESKEINHGKTTLEPWEISSLASLRQLKPEIRMELVGHIARLAKLFNSDGDRMLAGQAIRHLAKGVGQLPGLPEKNASRITKTKSSHDNSTKDQPGQESGLS